MKKTFLLISIISIAFLSGCGGDDPQPSFEEQLAIDEGLIESYLTSNNITAQEHESGIRYVINSQGIGVNPQIGDRVTVKFTSYNLAGVNRGEDLIGFTLDLDEEAVIESWILMMPEVTEGGKITIYSPSGYVFGPEGNSVVPPNEIIVFEIELIAIIDSEDEQFNVETNIIDDFLIENSILADTDPSGIRFVVIDEGTGELPTLEDNILVEYEGSFLNGSIFDRSQTGGTLLSLQTVIEAWQIMVPQINEGGRIRIYAPSEYCYGTTGNGLILPYTVLVFEIEVLEIRN